jgi:hypothetical protein
MYKDQQKSIILQISYINVYISCASNGHHYLLLISLITSGSEKKLIIVQSLVTVYK